MMTIGPDGRSSRSERARVTIDEEGVVRTLSPGRSERVKWRDLREVWLLTTADGPFTSDLCWVLIDRSGGCVVPLDSPGSDQILVRLQLLPGFDNRSFVSAMSSAEHAWFQCWESSWDGTPPPLGTRPGEPRMLSRRS